MGTADSRIDAYIDRAAPFARPILTHLRDTVRSACPDAHETLKWGRPTFLHHGLLCSMAAFKAHCSFGFWKDVLLKDAPVPARDRAPVAGLGRITSVAELPSRKALVTLVRAAAALNEAGVKVPARKRARRPPVKVPAYFLVALKKDKRAFDAFSTFSDSHRREYVEWVGEAKTEETRLRRIATSIQWLSGGKSRNWKYERG